MSFEVGDKVKIKEFNLYGDYYYNRVGIVTAKDYNACMVSSFPSLVEEHTLDVMTGDFHLCFLDFELEFL